MCMFNSAPAAPGLPAETAAMRFPDTGTAPGAAVRSAAARRMGDKLASSTPTVLTSQSGVTTFAPTEKHTLLGQ